MKHAVAALLALVLVGAASQARAGDLEDKRDKLLAEEWLKKVPWITDYDKARDAAKASGKTIFAYFTRSYALWPPCKALERGALSDPKFADFAKNHVLFCHITTRIEGEKYGNLLTEKGGQGFPFLVFMDPEGNVLVEHEGPRSVAAFEETAKKADAFLELEKKAEKGDKKALVEVVFTQLKGGRMKMADADKKLTGVELTADQKKELEEIRPNAEVRDIANAASPHDEAGMVALGKTFAERRKAGKPAPTGETEMQTYYIMMMKYAEHEKDVALYEEAMKPLEAKFGSNPQAKGFFKRAHATLEKLKAEKGGEKKEDEKK